MGLSTSMAIFDPIDQEEFIAGGKLEMDAEWVPNPEYPEVLELKRNGKMIAWIERRPYYCDRGHYRAQVEVRGVHWDEMDGRLRYYMSLQTAKEEIITFVNWRLLKIRGEFYR